MNIEQKYLHELQHTSFHDFDDKLDKQSKLTPIQRKVAKDVIKKNGYRDSYTLSAQILNKEADGKSYSAILDLLANAYLINHGYKELFASVE